MFDQCRHLARLAEPSHRDPPQSDLALADRGVPRKVRRDHLGVDEARADRVAADVLLGCQVKQTEKIALDARRKIVPVGKRRSRGNIKDVEPILNINRKNTRTLSLIQTNCSSKVVRAYDQPPRGP